MKKNTFTGKKQNLKKGTIHYRRNFKEISKIDLKKKYLPMDLFNIIRSKMFNPHDQAYFTKDKKKYYISVKIKKK